ncbi:Epididymal secretory protein E1 [Fasciola hepatica]|uniref:Epididymal secretory protein E1 n=1 Tax=Fasciola hepatica TaxID=6192 RepID=A0A4E0RV44_FASHE|nr:Epididymal secretory protein E1 [Fasciola hepatica]
MFLWRILLLINCTGFSIVFGSKFKDCGSKVGSALTVNIEPCDTNPCTLYKGENATIEIGFNANKNFSDATVSVHGIIAHVPVPFPLHDSSVCHFVQPSCPLTPENNPYAYKFALPIETSYPSIRLVIRWEFKDQDNEDIICVEFPAQLSSRSHFLGNLPNQVPMMRLTPAKRRS